MDEKFYRISQELAPYLNGEKASGKIPDSLINRYIQIVEGIEGKRVHQFSGEDNKKYPGLEVILNVKYRRMGL